MSAISERQVPKPDRLLWVDCEFTGLSVEEDHLLEVAAIATDFQLNELGAYESFVSQDIGAVLLRMAQDDWWGSRPEHRRQVLDGVAQSNKTLSTIQDDLITFTESWCGTSSVILAGNSVYNDRNFLAAHCPQFTERLGYRILDVSSLKILVAGHFGVEMQKQENHRAGADIRESIEELRYTLGYMGQNVLHAMSAH